MMNDYLVVESQELAAVAKRVVEEMNKGYFPLGNIAIYNTYNLEGDNISIFYQAMASYKS